MWHINVKRLEDALFTKRWCIDRLTGDSVRLTELLHEAAPHIPADEWPERIRSGGAHLNGAPIVSDGDVHPPARVEYFEPRTFPLPSTAYPSWSSDWIVFEDDDVIVINKPARLPTLPVREQATHNVRSYLEHYVGGSVHLPSRLDTSTTGLVIASKSPRTHRALQHAFEHRLVTKRYRSELTGDVSFAQVTFSSPIGYHPLHPVLRATHSRGKSALTTFSLIESRTNTALVDALPLTGRTHQIRVHAAALGYPLVGDNFYNGAEATSLHLCCIGLLLPHPRNGSELAVTIPDDKLPRWATKNIIL